MVLASLACGANDNTVNSLDCSFIRFPYRLPHFCTRVTQSSLAPLQTAELHRRDCKFLYIKVVGSITAPFKGLVAQETKNSIQTLPAEASLSHWPLQCVRSNFLHPTVHHLLQPMNVLLTIYQLYEITNLNKIW